MNVFVTLNCLNWSSEKCSNYTSQCNRKDFKLVFLDPYAFFTSIYFFVMPLRQSEPAIDQRHKCEQWSNSTIKVLLTVLSHFSQRCVFEPAHGLFPHAIWTHSQLSYIKVSEHKEYGATDNKKQIQGFLSLLHCPIYRIST